MMMGTDPRTDPLYFFDQPTRRNRVKGTRSSVLHFNVGNHGGPHLEESHREEDDKEAKLSAELNVSAETCVKPDTAALDVKDRDPMDAYKRAAPQLLNELAHLLSQHKWSEEGCLPRGIVNILNYSWHDLTAGALHKKSEKLTDARRKSKGSLTHRQMSATSAREEARQRGAVGSTRKPQVTSNPRVRRLKKKYNRDSSTASFSLSSGSCEHAGWIVEPMHSAACDEPQWIGLCQCVVKRLQAARDPEKQSTEQGQNRPIILHHYGDTKAKLKDSRRKAPQRLHYMTSDGSSVIYYPSGCIAVCQSHSGLPCGGFYTNVFSDGQCPVILASVTAFGHGAVTHPVSSVITAVWDPGGGFLCDHYGNITKEWSWQTDRTRRSKIDIQVSDVISVQLFSSTSAMLSFKCENKSLQLPLRFLSNINLSKVSVCSQEVLQMVKEVEELEEPTAQWRRGGQAGRELRRLQQRVQHTVKDWLDFYRVATGIRCPDKERMPDVPPRTRLRTEVQSAALPSLNPPQQADTKHVQPEEDELHRHRSAPAVRLLESAIKTQRTPKMQAKPKPPVTLIGPLQIYGDIRPESVTLLDGPEFQTSTADHSPAAVPFAPSIPLTVCPALLRAALLGEGQRRRRCCCCSAALMPVVTDLEYDAFVMGQPPHTQQILVVCVTLPHQPVSTHAVPGRDVLDELYRSRNKHRTMPCTQ
ncbi:uncharacterized protein C3orf20-like isoform X2 [Parambassis ranga]|nr:uncharacterized protein C3orf20 homolog isoform X2 [Parambassis ranga]